MENICLVKAGNYLIGIDTATILRQQEINSFVAEEQGDDVPLILLASLFDKCGGVFPDSEEFILEVKSTTTGSQMLVINGFSAEPVAVENFESLPHLYPDQARLCCPQIMIHEEQPVLVLDIEGLEKVLALPNNNSAVISLGALREHCSREDEIPEEQVAAKLDGATFDTIVSLTIAEFIKRGSDENCVITLDELFLESVLSLHAQDLIDKTVQGCVKFHTAAMRRLRQASALKNL